MTRTLPTNSIYADQEWENEECLNNQSANNSASNQTLPSSSTNANSARSTFNTASPETTPNPQHLLANMSRRDESPKSSPLPVPNHAQVHGKPSTDDHATQTLPTPHPPSPPSSVLPETLLELHPLTHAGVPIFLAIYPNVQTQLLTPSIAACIEILYPHWIEGTPPLWPEVRVVKLALKDMDGVAVTSGAELDNSHKTIQVGLNYLRHVWEEYTKAAIEELGRSDEKDVQDKEKARRAEVQRTRGVEAFKHEVLGVATHEMVHCYQHAPNNSPGGLIEGIADFVRLKAGRGAAHWKRPGKKDTIDYDWDVGYERTAYFLEWLEDKKVGGGFVRRLNGRMGSMKEYEEKVWIDLAGKDVKDLWKEYKGAVQSGEVGA